MNNNHFDLFIIGTGTAAYHIAAKSAETNLRVAIVDKQPYGGTCALRGCQPKKFYVEAIAAFHAFKNLKDKGLSGNISIDWQKIRSRIKDFADNVPTSTENSFKNSGITTLHGETAFLSENSVSVGDEVYTADRFVIATGSKSRELRSEGSEHVSSSTDFLYEEKLPQKIVFIGGGYISFEFAQIAALAGSEVTILHRSDQVLKNFEPDLVESVVKASEDLGIRVITNAPLSKVEKNNESYHVYTEANETPFVADKVYNGAGRVPQIEALNLEKGNIEFSRKGVVVNEELQSTTNKNVWSVGDCASTPYMLASTADQEGAELAKSLLSSDEHHPIKYNQIPSVLFTHPALSTVGITEKQAREQGHDVLIFQGSTTGYMNTKRVGESYGSFKIIIDKSSNTFLGVHLFGHKAEEIINIFALAMREGVDYKNLKTSLWAYPTFSADIKSMLS